MGDIHFLRQRGDILFLAPLKEDMTESWRDYGLGELTITNIGSNHFDCLTGENAQSIVKLLAAFSSGVATIHCGLVWRGMLTP